MLRRSVCDLVQDAALAVPGQRLEPDESSVPLPRVGEQVVQLAEFVRPADEPRHRSASSARRASPRREAGPLHRAEGAAPFRGDRRGRRRRRRSALAGLTAGADRGSRRGPAARTSRAPGRWSARRTAAIGEALPRPRRRAAASRSGIRRGRRRESRGPMPGPLAPWSRPIPPVSGTKRDPPSSGIPFFGPAWFARARIHQPGATRRRIEDHVRGFTAPWTSPRPWIASSARSESIATVRARPERERRPLGIMPSSGRAFDERVGSIRVLAPSRSSPQGSTSLVHTERLQIRRRELADRPVQFLDDPCPARLRISAEEGHAPGPGVRAPSRRQPSRWRALPSIRARPSLSPPAAPRASARAPP